MKKKFKVTFHLMVDPTKGDATFPKSYKVDAIDKNEAYTEAEKLLDKEPDEFSKRSIFDYTVKEL